MNIVLIEATQNQTRVVSEWGSNEIGARVAFHQLCASLWNASEAVKASIKLMDDQLDNFEGVKEYIDHPAKNETKKSKKTEE